MALQILPENVNNGFLEVRDIAIKIKGCRLTPFFIILAFSNNPKDFYCIDYKVI